MKSSTKLKPTLDGVSQEHDMYDGILLDALTDNIIMELEEHCITHLYID